MASPLLATAAVLQGIGALANLFGGRKARRDARTAQKRQRRADAIHGLQAAASGGIPGAPRAEAPLPQVNTGGALSQLGSILGTIDSANRAETAAAEDRKFKLDMLANQTPQGQTTPELGVEGLKAPTAAAVPRTKTGMTEVQLRRELGRTNALGQEVWTGKERGDMETDLRMLRGESTVDPLRGVPPWRAALGQTNVDVAAPDPQQGAISTIPAAPVSPRLWEMVRP